MSESNQPRDRAKEQPALCMAATEACVTRLTDGFCTPRLHPTCTRCWKAAEDLMAATGLSARAATWVFAYRSRIEDAAKHEYNGRWDFDPRTGGNPERSHG